MLCAASARVTAVGHLEASRERERGQKTHLEKGRKYQAYVEDDRMGMGLGRGKSSVKAATANGGTN